MHFHYPTVFRALDKRKSDLRQILFAIFQIKRLAMTPTSFETFSGLGIGIRLPLRLFFPYI